MGPALSLIKEEEPTLQVSDLAGRSCCQVIEQNTQKSEKDDPGKGTELDLFDW